MLAHVGKVRVQCWLLKVKMGVRTTATGMTSRAEAAGERYRCPVMGALTLRDGPIWWHYQSVSGISNSMLADATNLMLAVGGGRQGAGRGRGDYKLVNAAGRAIDGALAVGRPSGRVCWWWWCSESESRDGWW
jgi:hypothetical protein